LRRIILLACAFVALVCAGIAAATLITFGSTDSTVSTLTDFIDTNTKGVSQLTAPASSGKLTEIDAYYDGKGKTSGSEKLRLVVYADSSGSPGAFIGVTNELSVSANAAAGWHAFTFATQPSVSANQKIWVGYWGGGTTTDLVRPYYDTAAGSVKYNTNTYSSTGNPSNPFGTASTNSKGHPWAIRAVLDDGQTCTPVTSTVTTTTTVTQNFTSTVVSTVTQTVTNTTTVTTTVPGPTTTVTTTVTVTNPPPPSIPAWPRAGISYGWQIATRDASSDISYDTDLHAKGIRFDYGWGGANKDALVTSLKNANPGFDVYLLLGSTIFSNTTLTPADVQTKCHDIAAQWDGIVFHYVFGNEPNLHGWQAASYLPYQQACYNGLHSGSSRVVLSLNIGNHWGGSVQWNDPNEWFSSYITAANGIPYADAIDVHLYDDPAEVGPWSPWCMTFGCTNYYATRNIVQMESQWGLNLPILAGESGGPTPKYTLMKQATIVTNDLTDPRPVATYVYSLRDNDDCNPSCATAGFGLLDSNLNPRPAYTSFQNAAAGL
jgi:hypothetical protein